MDSDLALTGDSSNTGGTTVMTPQQLYAALLPELKEKGFFEVFVNVQSTQAEFDIKTDLYASVESFKSLVEDKFELPTARQCLIYDGSIMEDHRTLESYGVGGGQNVYLIVLRGPHQNQATNATSASPTTARNARRALNAGASPAHIVQGMYDSDPFFRQMMKSPALFRRFSSPSAPPMTEQEMMTIHLSLLSGLGQQQTTGDAPQTGGATRNVTAPNNSNGSSRRNRSRR